MRIVVESVADDEAIPSATLLRSRKIRDERFGDDWSAD
jgi:hypothetical protein